MKEYVRKGTSAKGSMKSVAASEILVEEGGPACVFIGRVKNEKVAQRNSLLNGEIESKPTETLVSQPNSESAVSKKFSKE